MNYSIKHISLLLILIAFTTGKTSGQVIDTGDKVGIGVNPPIEKLHINGSIRGGDATYGALRISTPTGYVDVGSMNESYGALSN